MTWSLTAVASWVLIYLTMWKFPTMEVLQLVLLCTPLAVGILMCRANRKSEISLDGTVFGGIIWVILNVVVGSVLVHLVSQKTFYAYETSEEWKSANFTCVIYTLLFALLPPLMAVIWRIILNIRRWLRKKTHTKSLIDLPNDTHNSPIGR